MQMLTRSYWDVLIPRAASLQASLDIKNATDCSGDQQRLPCPAVPGRRLALICVIPNDLLGASDLARKACVSLYGAAVSLLDFDKAFARFAPAVAVMTSL